MALSLQLGYPDIPKSITNPNVKRQDALDISNPLPFLTFIKIISVSFEPDSLQSYYNFYLKTWNSISTSKQDTDSQLIIDNYKNFLRELTLNYTTLEEKKFLSKIDFDDPYDLDIAMGFFSRKLKELASYYNDKRNDIKFNTIRKKLKGTNFGSEKTITELTLSYLKTLDDGKILYDYDLIKSQIDIEVEELYDVYPLYFNQEPNDRIYDNKDLDYGLDIFLKDDQELINEVFSGYSDEMKSLREVDQLFENKRKLTENSVYTDFYYLSTGSTVSDYISGKLFTSTNPIGNFLNRSYPTTASTQREYLETPRERGFFRPTNTAIILVDGLNKSFQFNFDKIQPNSLYYFPDPSLIGDNGDIITFIVDDSYLKRNFSSGNAVNQPYSTQYDTKYYGYVSRIDPNQQKYLDSVFDMGYIKDMKRDMYNNLFGLFVNDGRFEKTVEYIDTESRLNIVFNGYKFFDDMYNEGFSFNYATSDDSTFTQTIRSGLSTNCGPLSVLTPDIVLSFGSFIPFQELIEPTEENLVTQYEIYEGGFFADSYSIPYPEAVSSDLSAFEASSGPFYYDTLVEGGLHSLTPKQRALNDPLYPSLTANMTITTRGSALDIVDGGFIGQPFDGIVEIPQQPYTFDVTSFNPTTLTTAPQISSQFDGKLMVRNVYNRQVLPILDAMPHLITKYPSDVLDEIDGSVQKFELTADVLFIETSHYLTINKISFNDGFVDPKTTAITFEHSLSSFDKVSNRFKINNDVYFCQMNTSGSLSSNNFVLYPTIYKFDLLNFKYSELYPINVEIDTAFFNVSGGDIRYTSCDSPTLTYSSRNNIFNISVLLKDQNNMPILHEYDFYLNPDVIFTSHNIHTFGYGVSNIFNSLNITCFLSSGNVITQNEELIL